MRINQWLLLAALLLSQLAFHSPKTVAQSVQDKVLKNRVKQTKDQGVNYEKLLARYNGRTINYPAVGQVFKLDSQELKADLRLLKKLLNVTSIRVFLSPAESDLSELPTLMQICQEEGFKLEVSLFEGVSDYKNIAQSQQWLNRVLDLVYNDPRVLLLTVQRHIDWKNPQALPWLETMIQTIRKREKPFDFQLQTQSINGLKYLSGLGKKRPFIASSYHTVGQIEQFKAHLGAQPDVHLFHTEVPPHYLRNTLQKATTALKGEIMQISSFSSETPLDEYQQAWLHRYVFYFTKKHQLAFPSVSFYDTQVNGRFYPGIVRKDKSLKSAFLYAQIFYQLRTLDVSEHMITDAIYSPTSETPAKVEKRDSFVKQFLLTYYKRRNFDNVLNYISDKNTAFYYKYIQFKVEESILNSHFAKLNEVKILESEELGSRRYRYKVSNAFSSAVGDYVFEQSLVIQALGNTWITESLSEPKEALSALRAFPEKDVSAESFTLNLPSELKAHLTLLKSEQPGRSHLLHFKLTNQSEQRVDIKPIELQVPDLQKTFKPPTLLFDYFKNVQPGQSVEGFIPFDYHPQNAYRFYVGQIKAESGARFDNNLLKALQLRLMKQTSEALQIEVYNPNVERAIVPSLFFSLDTGQGKLMGEQILTRALLPFEKRQLSIPLGDQKFRPETLHIQGKFYPVVDFVLNLDEAFRYKTLDYFSEALQKYRYLLLRFDSEIADIDRYRIWKEIFGLEMQLNQFDHALQTALKLVTIPPGERAKIAPYFEATVYEPFLKKGAYAESLQLLELFIKESPQNIQLLKARGYVLKQLKHPIAALESYLQAYALKPESQTAENIAYLHQQLGNHESAVYYFYEVLRFDPEKVTLYKNIAYLHQQDGQIAKAIGVYETYLKHRFEVDIVKEVAGLYLKLGKTSKAIQTYHKALKVCPNCVALYQTLAYLYKQTGNTEQAIVYYGRHARLTGNVSSYQTQANLLEKRGRVAEAYRVLQQAVRVCGRCTLLYKELGYLAKSQGLLTASKTYYARYIQSHRDPRVQRELAYLYYQDKEYIKAMPLFQTLPAAYQNSESAAALGFIYRQVQRPDKAIPIFKSLVQRFPDRRNYFKNYVFAIAESRRPLNEAELVFLENALKREGGTSFEMLYNLGQVYIRFQRWQKAETVLQRALSQRSDVIAVYKLLAKAFEKQGKLEQAIDVLTQADKRLEGMGFQSEIKALSRRWAQQPQPKPILPQEARL